MLHQNKLALFHNALTIQNGAQGFVCISTFKSSVDSDLQCFFNEYFVDTDSDDDDVEFECFTPEDIRGRPVYLMQQPLYGELLTANQKIINDGGKR